MLPLVTILSTLSGGLRADENRLVVFAAASLQEALAEIAQGWATPVRISAGGSGAMARQIDQGAPADVAILAHGAWMDWLETRGQLLAGTRTTPIGNKLVLVGPPGAEPFASLSVAALLARLGDGGRLATGEHRAVPAGQYAKQWLEGLGWWKTLRPHLAEVDNVRAAVTLVSRAETPLALIYASDLVAAPDAADVVWSIPDSEQPDIRYHVAAISVAGQAFAKYLSSPEAIEIFENSGFSRVDP